MLNWMSFNGGIGMHSLTTKGYYKYLGKKNVSHGCVRFSREDAQELYNTLEKGTPVLVHKGTNAIVIAFGNPGEVYKYYTFIELKKLLPERLSTIYNGRYFINSKQKILIDENNVNASGLAIGNTERIPTKQLVFSNQIYINNEMSEKEKLDLILSGKPEKNIRLSFHPFLDSLYAQK